MKGKVATAIVHLQILQGGGFFYLHGGGGRLPHFSRLVLSLLLLLHSTAAVSPIHHHYQSKEQTVQICQDRDNHLFTATVLVLVGGTYLTKISSTAREHTLISPGVAAVDSIAVSLFGNVISTMRSRSGHQSFHHKVACSLF